MARRYQLDDPALQTELDRLAADDTANWPDLSEQGRAQLARILPSEPTTAVPQPRQRPTRTRRAA